MTEAELYQALLQRVDFAQRYLQRRIPRRMRRLISADDVLQDAWISAFRSSGTFIAVSSDAFDRWFMTIVRSRLLNAVRYANQAIRCPDRLLETGDRSGSYMNLLARLTDSGKTASSQCAGQEALQAMRLAMSALPEDYRQVITLHYIDGQTHADVATVMNKSKDAVRALLYRGVLQLKELILSRS